MIYIKFDKNFIVNYIHYMPFHEIHGLHKTKEELLKDGKLIDDIPKSYNGLTLFYNQNKNIVEISKDIEIPKDIIIKELEKKIDEQDIKLLDAEFKLAMIDFKN